MDEIHTIHLTEEQMDKIAEKAAARALAKVYEEVGRSVIRKLCWLAGIIAVGLLIFLAGKDALPFK